MTRKEERTENAVKKGYESFANSFNCAQSTLAGLMHEFLPDDPCTDALLCAAFPLAGGGCRNDTCGGLNGGLVFMGRLYHKDETKTPFSMDPSARAVRGFGAATELADRFEEKMGSTQCGHIHSGIMGKEYDLADPKSVAKFYMDGAKDDCQAVVETGIRLVCDLIMDDEGNVIGL